MDQRHGAGQSWRRCYPLLVVIQQVVRLAGGQVDHIARVNLFFLETGHRIGAIHLRRSLDEAALQAGAEVAGDVVPEHLNAIFRDREGVEAAASHVGQAVAFVDFLHLKCAVPGRLLDFGRNRRSTVARVDGNPVSVRIAFEHGHLAVAELVLVLRGVGCRDDEQRLLAGERVLQETVSSHLGGVLGQSPGPGRNAAIGVAFLLRAQRRQRGA
ncbi:hypothetical protein D9M71_428590 [compost metagenome]